MKKVVSIILLITTISGFLYGCAGAPEVTETVTETEKETETETDEVTEMPAETEEIGWALRRRTVRGGP